MGLEVQSLLRGLPLSRGTDRAVGIGPRPAPWPRENDSPVRPRDPRTALKTIPRFRGSRSRRMDLACPRVAGAVIDHLRRAPVLIVLPSVYALMAAPTALGITGLNGMKRRIPGKNYGTAVGRLSKFWNLVEESSIPRGFDGPSDLESNHDIFFRCRVGDENIQTPVIRDGTNQTLILGGAYRSLMCEIEEAFQGQAAPELFGGHRFSAPLITSCNLSGDPLGSITDESRARNFAEERGVGLWITASSPSDESGSYPILELEKSGISIRREGGSIREREIYQRFRKGD